MDRSQKEELVRALKSIPHSASLVVVARQKGLTVAEATSLRALIKSSGAGLKMAKNNLAKLAIQGTSYENLASFLSGPTILAYSIDPIAAAKAVVKFADSNDKLLIAGGMMKERLLDASSILALAKLPSLDELRSQIIGVISAPATKFVRVMKEPSASLARVIQAHTR